MRLPKIMDRTLLVATVVILTFVFVFGLAQNNHDTYAGGEEEVYEEHEENFVIFYDEGNKLIVKTNARTVGEVVARAGIQLNSSDIIEPSLDTEINANNFFINIYRARPVVIKDGMLSKYIMSASYDVKTIAREAGFTVYDGDEVELVTESSFLEVGAATVYNIIRNGGRKVTIEEEIPFDEEQVKDYNLAPGTRELRQLGEVGVKEIVYEVYYENNVEVKRELISETVKREPVTRIVAVGANPIEKTPLTAMRGVNYYTIRVNGVLIERKETYYDLPMGGVMAIAARECGVAQYYTVREDGVKVDAEGYVLVAADLTRYPRCTVVETSLGIGRVYDTGTFAKTNAEQFDLATDWTIRDGK